MSKLPELIIPLATTAAPDLHGVDYTERVQSFFPECKEYRLKLFTPKIMELSFVTPQMCRPDMTGNNSIGFESCLAIVFSI